MRSNNLRIPSAMRQLALIPLLACGLLSIIASGGGGGGGGVSVTPSPSNDADLTDLVLAGVVLDQIFQPTQTDYTATVSLLRSTTAVTATPSDPNATMTVDGGDVGAGVASAKITLNQGNNTITVVVTAENGSTTTTYTIEVTRETAASFVQRAYTKASNTDTGDRFGAQVALDGDTLAVGTISEDSNATGVNGDQADNSAPGAGVAYVFKRDASGVWSQQAYIKASNTAERDFFGNLAFDGDTLAVGALGEDSNATGVNEDQSDNSVSASGAVYVYTRDASGVWTQQAYLKASNTDAGDQFGQILALDGDTLAVGTWAESSNATGVDGDQADNSAMHAGAVYIFTRDASGVWTQKAYLKASNTEAFDRFGSRLALDGDTVAIGAWLESSGATGINGDQADNSADLSGAVYVFTRDAAGMWSQQAYIKASNTDEFDFFGWDLDLDGNTLAVGADCEGSAATGVNGFQNSNSVNCAGAAYVFTRDVAGVWSQQAYIKASNTDGPVGDSFGWSVALDGDALAVGAVTEDSSATGVNGDQTDNSAADSGAVYIFTRDADGVWSQQAYIKASNTEADDGFGGRVALAGDILAVGTIIESSNATGIDGDQADNSAIEAGAVYVFD